MVFEESGEQIGLNLEREIISNHDGQKKKKCGAAVAGVLCDWKRAQASITSISRLTASAIH